MARGFVYSVSIGLAEARQPSGMLSLNKPWYAGGDKREDAVRILHGRTAQQNAEKQSPARLKTMSVKPATFSSVMDEWLHWNDSRIEPSTIIKHPSNPTLTGRVIQ